METQEFRPTSGDIPGQKLPYPARQSDMDPAPDSDLSNYKPAGKLTDKVAIITGADSGIGRAVAIAFAMEGANVAIVYNENTDDAKYTKRLVESKGRSCLVIQADVRSSANCQDVVKQTVAHYGKLNILVNNAAYQMAQEKLEDITEEQLRRTFDTNILAYFFMAQAALPHLHEGDAIVNTGSIVGIVGNPILVDYTATKGAIHSFTKSLAIQLGPKNIRVNCVAPGPVWTPNIPATMPEDEVKNFGHEVALARPGQPEEIAPAYVLLASSEGSFMTGSIVEVTGGKLGQNLCVQHTLLPSPTTLQHPMPYPTGTVRALLDTNQVTDVTRQVLTERLSGQIRQPAFFSADEFALLQAICDRLIPQDEGTAYIDIAGGIDRRLSEQKSDGWRYDTMPADGDAYKLGLKGIDESAQLLFKQPFRALSGQQQDQILKSIQTAQASGEIWQKLPANRFFEELLAESVENYYSHPLAQEEIGYVGMADAPGWQLVGLNQLEDREPREIK